MSKRRDEILDAAQRLFLERGFAATTISDIRDASGASVGSIYHAFGSKDGIACALVSRAVEGWTQATQRARKGDTIEDLMRATVEGLLRWAAASPDSFRVMDDLRSVSYRGEAGERLGDMLRKGRAESRLVLEEHASSGAIRKMDPQLAQALVLGPAYEYLRSCDHLVGEMLDELVGLLSEAAWNAISARTLSPT